MNIIPVITEKSMLDAKSGKYTFTVDSGLNKNQIKVLIGQVFNVHVTSVKTLTYKGRIKKNFKGNKVTIAKFKKTIVTLLDKEKIDLFETKEDKKGKK
jgi:large subunit ribosomal protein L23